MKPVFTPIAPGYSQSNTLRFCTVRSGPVLETTSWVFVPTTAAKRGCRMATRVSVAKSRAVEYPESSRPFGEAKCVFRNPRRVALRFIASTNASVVPETCSANATAASLAD